jgi:palmitoyltransferase
MALLFDLTFLKYLGPTPFQLSQLFVLLVCNSFVLFALVLLLGRTIWSMSLNMTTIEGWEVERHATVLRRARTLGGYLDGPDGKRVHIEHQEFPWDIGIWTNLCEMMGSRNPLAWFWPFARSMTVETGLHFEYNGIDGKLWKTKPPSSRLLTLFADPSKPWPPPDPDRMLRLPRQPLSGNGFTQPLDVNEFRKRQEADLARHADADGEYVVRRKPFHERLEDLDRANRASAYNDDETAIETDSGYSGSESEDDQPAPTAATAADGAGEEGWRNKEGERLADFGVDEVADFYDEDDLPLAEIMRRRKAGH